MNDIGKTPGGRKLLFSLVSGSRLYGTNTPESDTDIRGVCFPNISELVGLGNFEQENKIDSTLNIDYNYYDIRKFLNLILKGNMNVFDYIFCNKEKYTYILDENFGQKVKYNPFELIRLLCQVLISKRYAKATFGYISGLKHRMKNEQSNNKGRGDNVKKWGYDPKDFAHGIRLLRQCSDVFDYGFPIVDRSQLDAEFLKKLRSNPLEVEDAIKLLEEEIEKTKESEIQNKAKIKDKPNFELANSIIEMVLIDYIIL